MTVHLRHLSLCWAPRISTGLEPGGRKYSRWFTPDIGLASLFRRSRQALQLRHSPRRRSTRHPIPVSATELASIQRAWSTVPGYVGDTTQVAYEVALNVWAQTLAGGFAIGQQENAEYLSVPVDPIHQTKGKAMRRMVVAVTASAVVASGIILASPGLARADSSCWSQRLHA